MDQKVQMIADYLSQEYSITQLSRRYEVSRKTVYKWTGRYRREGPRAWKSAQRHPGCIPTPHRQK